MKEARSGESFRYASARFPKVQYALVIKICSGSIAHEFGLARGNNDRRLLDSITPETRVSRMVSETGDPPWVTDPGSCRWFHGDERPVRVRVVP